MTALTTPPPFSTSQMLERLELAYESICDVDEMYRFNQKVHGSKRYYTERRMKVAACRKARAILDTVYQTRSLEPLADADNETLDQIGYWVRCCVGSGRAHIWSPNWMQLTIPENENGEPVDYLSLPDEALEAYVDKIKRNNPEAVLVDAWLRQLRDDHTRSNIAHIGDGGTVLVWMYHQPSRRRTVDDEWWLASHSGKLRHNSDGSWDMVPRYITRHEPIITVMNTDGTVPAEVQEVLAYFKKDRH